MTLPFSQFDCHKPISVKIAMDQEKLEKKSTQNRAQLRKKIMMNEPSLNPKRPWTEKNTTF